MGWSGRTGWTVGAASLAFLFVPAYPALPAFPALATPQVTFERTVADLKNPDAAVRLRAVQLLKDAAYPEGAVPLAAAVLDADDNVQLEAIAAELNTFLAEKVVAKKKVGLIIEVRNKIVAESAFSAGPFVLGADPVPLEVLTALRRAVHDDNPRVGLEALYAFGTLAGEAGGAERREMLRQTALDLAPMPGALDESLQIASLRVIERVFAVRPLDPPIDQALGDTVVAALNDKHSEVRLAAIETLGRIRYARAVQALADLEQFYGRGAIAEAAFDALARIAQPASRSLFFSGLSSKSPAVKRAAIEGLVRINDRSTAEAVQSALAGGRVGAVGGAIFIGDAAWRIGRSDRAGLDARQSPRPGLRVHR